MYVCVCVCVCVCVWGGPGSSVGTGLTKGWTVRGSNPGEARFYARPDRSWGSPSLLYNGYRLVAGGKERPGPDADILKI